MGFALHVTLPSGPVNPAGVHLGRMLPKCLQRYAWTGTCSQD